MDENLGHKYGYSSPEVINNSAQHEICLANKSEITDSCYFVLAGHS